MPHRTYDQDYLARKATDYVVPGAEAGSKLDKAGSSA